MSDENEITQTLSTFYEIISGPKTKNRDWEKMRSLFYPGAVLFPNAVTQNPVISQGIDIETYIQRLDRFLSQNDFYEQGEISQITVQSNLASVLSTYEARQKDGDELLLKHGANFVHMINIQGEWKITSMIWRDK